MRVLNAELGRVTGLAFSPDGRALAAAVEDQGVFLWNLENNDLPQQLDPSTRRKTQTLYFSPDSRAVGWAGSTGWKVFDRTRKRIAQLSLEAGGKLTWISQTPDGSRVVSDHSFPESSLIAWKSVDGGGWEQEWSVSKADLGFHSTTVCPTGRRVATLARSATGRVRWETPFRLQLRSGISGRVEASSAYSHNYPCALVFSPDGELLVGVHDMSLMIWPVPDLGEPRLVRNTSRQHFTSAVFHPTGRYLFASSNDTTVHVFDVYGWDRIARFTWKLGRLRSVAVSPDGLLAAAGGDNGEVLVWDVDL
jgi:WD40 repeat protein